MNGKESLTTLTRPKCIALYESAFDQIIDGKLGRALDAVLSAFNPNDSQIEAEVSALLDQPLATGDERFVEAAFAILQHVGDAAEHLPLLCKLLQSEFHRIPEEIVHSQQQAADPSAIVSLRQAVLLKPRLEYLSHDDYGAYYRKCLWALGAIGTQPAIAVIAEFAGSEDPVLKTQAEYRLSRLKPSLLRC